MASTGACRSRRRSKGKRMNLYLLDIGGLWPLAADGSILNDASVDKIHSSYQPIVDAVVALYREHLGERLHSVYVRGTVPRGQAVPGVSDFDSFAVALADADALDDSWLAAAASAIARLHPIVSDVQLEIWPYAELLVTDRFTEMSFLLKTQSACVWGQDLGPHLPRFKPDVIVANNDISQIAPDIQQAIAAVQADRSPQNTRYWCRRIAKNMLRSGFSLVMLDERVFTRDLKLCYNYFAGRYPRQAQDMRRVLELAIQPSADPTLLLDLLDHFGRWLIAEAETWLSRHNPSKTTELPLA
jgi:uncharacterized protein